MNPGTLGLVLIALPVVLGLYAYVVYPALLGAIGLVRRPRALVRPEDVREWPVVCFSLPAYNEEERIRGALEAILATDYPGDRRRIVVVSDASTDRTDEIVREYASRGVELLRLPLRGGKTAAENAAAPHLRADIVVNTDASVRIRPDSLKPLVAALCDPQVGLASGRDMSWGDERAEENRGEAGYVGYEMWVRALETRVGSIVGASGCYYAIRPRLHLVPVPEHLSRDFASALIAREHGYRAVAVDDAVCVVPRAASLGREFRRKVRTLARGLDTLWYKRRLLDPLRYGGFSWMLASHKLARWLVPLTLPVGLLGLGLAAIGWPPLRPVLGLAIGLATVGVVVLKKRPEERLGRLESVIGYLTSGVLAANLAWLQFATRHKNPIWEPTRRPGPEDASPRST